MKVLFLTGREIGYQRNEVLLRAIQRFCDVEIVSTKVRPKSILVNSLKITFQSIIKLMSVKYDFIFAGFYGHLLMLPIGALARQPVLFDAFISTYDTLIEDRGIQTQGSMLARTSRWLDRTSCQLADLILLDTPIHISYFSDQFNLDQEKFRSIPVGCNEDIFSPRMLLNQSDKIRVIYYTSYLPLHGVEVVVRAAEKLKDTPVHFRLIGSGQTLDNSTKLANQLGLKNIEFVPPMPIESIANEIAQSNICLGGHFGTSEKAGRVIPGKIYQILAMGRPLIAGSTPANKELLSHQDTAFLCPQDDPDSLADAIITLARDSKLREWLAQRGNALYHERCSEAKITTLVRNAVTELVG